MSNLLPTEATLVDPLAPQSAAFRALGWGFSSSNLAWPSLEITRRSNALVMLSLSMLAALLTPAAVLAAVLGAWRFGADPGWTTPFFIASGLLSHWQAWFGVAIVLQFSSRHLPVHSRRGERLAAFLPRPSTSRPCNRNAERGAAQHGSFFVE